MISTEWLLYETAVIVAPAAVAAIILRKKLRNNWAMLLLVMVILWLGIFSSFISQQYQSKDEQITLTALNETSQGSGVSVAFKGLGKSTNGNALRFDQGWWPYDSTNGYYYWVPENDSYHQEGMTQSISFKAKIGVNRKIIFSGNPWSGKVQVDYDDVSLVVDTFSSVEFSEISVDIPSSAQIVQNAAINHFIKFAITYTTFCILLFVTILQIVRKNSLSKLLKYNFLFSQLIKRDFTLKYKRTALGMVWSIISPLLNLLIMWLVFNKLLGNNVNHFVIYLFAGQLVFSYFNDATNLGMSSLVDNSGIFTKVNVPKYMFLFSRNVSSLINFGITMLIFFVFIALEGLPFTLNYLMLVYPIVCIIIFNVGVGLILSALYVFFRDMQYLWGIFTQLLMWTSAIFYTIDGYSQTVQYIFLCNPIYLYIRYFRKIVIDATVPSVWFHLLAAAYAIIAFGVGSWLYKKYNHEFLYYV